MHPLNDNEVPTSEPQSSNVFLLALKVALVASIFVGIGLVLFSPPSQNAEDAPPRPSQPSASSPPPRPTPGDRPALPAIPDSQPDSLNSNPLDDLDEEDPGAIAANPSTIPIYSAAQRPNFRNSQDLDLIVNETLDWVAAQGLPLDDFSMTLIDLRQGTSAGYQEDIQRFPASIAKLFWMVELYAWMEAGLVSPHHGNYDLNQCQDDLCQMIQHSDNEAASRMMDVITGAYSGHQHRGESFSDWLAKRTQLNQFFEQANYGDIDISQKNFPIPYLNLDGPAGFDMEMRGDPDNPIRNQVTTAQAGRLMYEIFTDQAVSTDASRNMQHLLTRFDLQSGDWRNEDYNSIEGFFGEGLPRDVWLASKVGWTSFSRQEVAFIATPDSQAVFILAIFAEDSAYGNDWELFPEISQMVLNRMRQLSP